MTSRKRFSIVGTTTLLLIGAVSVVMAQTPGPGRKPVTGRFEWGKTLKL